jgi:hypothetical protein
MFYPGDPGVPGGVTHHHLAGFEPRLGLAWDPKGDARQSIRLSYTIFYDQPIIYFAQGADTSPPFGSSISINNPPGGFANPFLGFPRGNPFPYPLPSSNVAFPPAGNGFSVMPPHIQPTYDQQWELSYQHQVGRNWLITASYLGRKTTHLWASVAANPAVFIPGTCNGGPCSTTANTNQRRFLALLNPVAGASYASIVSPDDGANSEYNALLVSVQHRFSQQFSLIANYTYSHCISEWDTFEEEGSSYQDPHNRNASRGNCSYDHRHIFNASLVTNTPKFTSVWTQHVLGNWQFSPIISARSGDFINVTAGVDSSLTGVGLDRPNLVGSPYPTTQTIQNWMLRSAFQVNAGGSYGNLGRDTIQGPRFVDIDVALSRLFSIRERRQLEFRFEAFNIFNHANFNDPTSTLSSSNFGKILGANDPRILQCAVKFHF